MEANINSLPPITQLVIQTTRAKGVTFVSIVHTNKNGETARHTVNLNASYRNAVDKDIRMLQALDESYFDKYGAQKDLFIEAKDELLKSLIKPDEARSAGQVNAYERINNALKYHVETGELYLYGLRTKKEVIVEGVYKTVNSRPLTIAKNKLKKDLKFRSARYVHLPISQSAKCTINKHIIEFEE